MKRSFSIRKCFQFRLRTFIAAALVCGIFFGWIANEKSKHDRESVEIGQLLNPSVDFTKTYKLIRSSGPLNTTNPQLVLF